MNISFLCTTVLSALLFAAPCIAHLPSSSTLTVDLSGSGAQCTWSVPLSVLDEAFLFDEDADGKISAAEWSKAEEIIRREFLSGAVLTIGQKQICSTVPDVTVDTSLTAIRVIVKGSFKVETPKAPVRMTAKLLASVDPLHRIAVRTNEDGRISEKVIQAGSH